jgi:hypothetical protein
MRIIAFITYNVGIRKILEHIGAETEPPHITPARGPPLWGGVDAQNGEGVESAPNWEESCQAAPDLEANQRISWRGAKQWNDRRWAADCVCHCPYMG